MLKLVIGNKNYSSWSMRAWLCLQAFDIDFEEIFQSLNQLDWDTQLKHYSHSAKVPVLLDDDITVWDSLSIAEYVAQHYAPLAWPTNKKQRALARSISAEMHSSFYHLRHELPMNIRAKRQVNLPTEAHQNIDYIDALWKHYSTQSTHGWLFDTFSIADCMYAPVASRFQTYGIKLSEASLQYQQKLLQHPSVRLWYKQALEETEIVSVDEAGTEVSADTLSS